MKRPKIRLGPVPADVLRAGVEWDDSPLSARQVAKLWRRLREAERRIAESEARLDAKDDARRESRADVAGREISEAQGRGATAVHGPTHTLAPDS